MMHENVLLVGEKTGKIYYLVLGNETIFNHFGFKETISLIYELIILKIITRKFEKSSLVPMFYYYNKSHINNIKPATSLILSIDRSGARIFNQYIGKIKKNFSLDDPTRKPLSMSLGNRRVEHYILLKRGPHIYRAIKDDSRFKRRRLWWWIIELVEAFTLK